MARALKGLQEKLHLKVSVSVLEAQLDGLLRTLVFPGPLPSLKASLTFSVISSIRCLSLVPVRKGGVCTVDGSQTA